MVTAETPNSRVSPITLDKKRAGKPIAGNRHDGFEVAGAGNQLTVRLVRHSQRKRGATDRRNLRSMALALDPTGPSYCSRTFVVASCSRMSPSVSRFTDTAKLSYMLSAIVFGLLLSRRPHLG